MYIPRIYVYTTYICIYYIALSAKIFWLFFIIFYSVTKISVRNKSVFFYWHSIQRPTHLGCGLIYIHDILGGHSHFFLLCR